MFHNTVLTSSVDRAGRVGQHSSCLVQAMGCIQFAVRHNMINMPTKVKNTSGDLVLKLSRLRPYLDRRQGLTPVSTRVLIQYCHGVFCLHQNKVSCLLSQDETETMNDTTDLAERHYHVSSYVKVQIWLYT